MPYGPSSGKGSGLSVTLLQEMLRLISDWNIAFLGAVDPLLMTPGHFFFGLSLALKLLLPLGELILTLFAHISSFCHSDRSQVTKNPRSLFSGSGDCETKTKTKNSCY